MYKIYDYGRVSDVVSPFVRHGDLCLLSFIVYFYIMYVLCMNVTCKQTKFPWNIGQ